MLFSQGLPLHCLKYKTYLRQKDNKRQLLGKKKKKNEKSLKGRVDYTTLFNGVRRAATRGDDQCDVNDVAWQNGKHILGELKDGGQR